MAKENWLVAPNKVEYYAQKKSKKNSKFRVWLKMHVDPEDLDKQFHTLHNELFENYDCSQCRNCCKEYPGTFKENELDKVSKHLDMTIEDFKKKYIKDEKENGSYVTKNIPCDFLMENGDCMLGKSKPISCIQYPFTNQPDRMFSLYSFLQATFVCPVAYEICERLKEHYNFR